MDDEQFRRGDRVRHRDLTTPKEVLAVSEGGGLYLGTVKGSVSSLALYVRENELHRVKKEST